MRPRHFASGPAWRVNLATDTLPPPAKPVQQFALELPDEQKFALVYLRKAGPESAAAIVIRKLSDSGVPFPTGEPWRALRREGYVTLETGTRQGVSPGHKLTPKGNHAAADIIKDLCFRFSIHVFTISGGRGTGGGTWSRCSCGTWHTGPHNNDRFGESRLRTAQDSHIRDVTAGRWPGNTTALRDFLNSKPDLSAARPESLGTVAVSGAIAAVSGQEAQP